MTTRPITAPLRSPHASARAALRSPHASARAALLVFIWGALGCFCLGSGGDDDDTERAARSSRSDRRGAVSSGAARSEASAKGGVLKAGQRREAEVDAVWYQLSTKSGGTSPVEVRVEATPGGKPAVAVMEQHVDGTGNSWQASAWLAAINASRVTQNKLGDHEFMVKSGGFIDGPSAGLLMTSTMLALIKGDPIRQDTTMTGTINPDGTAGPVGGIPQKIEGAQKRGKKRFGFPIGAQRALDMKTGKTVDVIAHAEALGMEAKELSNLYDAYTFLTGARLERPEPVSESDMALGQALEGRMEERIDRVIGAFKEDVVEFNAQLKRAPEPVQRSSLPLMQAAASLLEQAGALQQRGDLPMSYYRYRQAGVLMALATLQLRVNTLLFTGKPSAAINVLRGERQAFNKRLAALKGDIERAAGSGTVGGQIDAVNALMSLQMAQTQMHLAELYFAPLEPTLKGIGASKNAAERDQAITTLLALLSEPLRYYARSMVQLDIAAEQLRTSDNEGRSSQSSARAIEQLAGAYASAAGAGLYNVDALVIEQHAKAQNITIEQASDRLAHNDDAYAMARGAKDAAQALNMYMEKGSKEVALSDLASGALAYNYAAELVNKYYALSLDPKTQRVTDSRVLILQLEQARVLCREAASLTQKAIGFVPAASRFYYQMANSLAVQPDDGDKLYALSLYWMSSFWSELAMALG